MEQRFIEAQQLATEPTKRIRILTTTIKESCPDWVQRAELLPGWKEFVDETSEKRRKAPLGSDIRWGWRLFRASRRYDVVVTGFERAAQILAVLQLLLRVGRVPHVFLYVNFNLPANSAMRVIKRVYFRLMIRSAIRVVTHSRRQAQVYAEAFRAPLEKFAPLRYYHGLYGVEYPTAEGDYIFSGGDYTRDYATLIKAVRRLPYRVVIAAFYRHYFRGVHIPPNVEVVTVTHHEFMSLMARSRLVVVPLQRGLLHPGGHLTFLSAMSLGKPVIVAEDSGADEYVTHGVNGMVLQPGDSAALREAITILMRDRTLARALGDAARAEAPKYTIDAFFNQLFVVIEQCLGLPGRPRGVVSPAGTCLTLSDDE